MSSGDGAGAPAPSERKKRALEALERRLAAEDKRLQKRQCPLSQKATETPNPVGLAEPEQREQRKRGRTPEKRRQELDHQAIRKANLAMNREDDDQSGERPGPRSKLSTNASSMKDEPQPVYLELSGSGIVVDDLLQSAGNLEERSAEDSVSNIVNDIVSKGDEGSKFVKRGKNLRIDSWILLDNFVHKDENLKDARLKAIKSLSKRSRMHMSMRQHRKCGSFNLPKEFHNFYHFTPMHEMWKSYILELLKETRTKQLSECLLRADLHGAFLLVAECKTSSFKGVSGIMIRETAEAFGIITRDNNFRVVPKAGSVFIFQADCWKITLQGHELSKKLSSQKSPQQLTRRN